MLAKRSFINMISGGVGYVGPILINLLSTPILLAKLGPASFGIQSLFNVIIGYFMIADMGLDVPITKFIAENNSTGNSKGNNSLLSGTLQIYMLMGIFGGTVLYFCSVFFSTRLFDIPENLVNDSTSVFRLASLGFFAGIINMWGRAALHGFHRYDLSNGISVFSGILGTIAGLVAVYLGNGVVGFVLAKVIFSLISLVMYISLIQSLSRGFKIGIDKEVWYKVKSYLGYGLVVRVSGMVLGKMDQTLIGIWLGVAVAGTYSISFLIPSTLCYFVASALTFIFPIICELHAGNRKKELQELYLNYSRILSIITSMLFFPLFLFGDKFLSLWVGDIIAEKSRIAFLLLSLSFFTTVLTIVLSNLFMLGIGQMKIYTRYTLIKGLATLGGLVVLIKPLGIEGAGVAVLLAGLCDLGFFLIATKHFLRIGLGKILKASYKPILVGLILSCLIFFARPLVNNWLALIIFNLLFLILFASTLFYFKLVNERERIFLLHLFSKHLKIGDQTLK